jgi:hypothetical protein
VGSFSIDKNTAEKMDEILVPIEISETLKMVKEIAPSYSSSLQPQ